MRTRNPRQFALPYNGFVASTRTIGEAMDTNVGRASQSRCRVRPDFHFSGRGDFGAPAAEVRRRGKHLTVVSTLATSPPMIADNLGAPSRSVCDLLDLKSRIARPKRLAHPCVPSAMCERLQPNRLTVLVKSQMTSHLATEQGWRFTYGGMLVVN